MKQSIAEVNNKISVSNHDEFVVVVNLADDLKGAWTNFYSTDYSSKFKLNAFLKRKFCVPYLWTSEIYTEQVIKTRKKEYLFRTLYQVENGLPKTLEEHLNQEIFVAKNSTINTQSSEQLDFIEIEKFYLQNNESDEYDLIFNFFYRDEGSESLGYTAYGNKSKTGFEYAQYKASLLTNA